jgi:hypothetical protein
VGIAGQVLSFTYFIFACLKELELILKLSCGHCSFGIGKNRKDIQTFSFSNSGYRASAYMAAEQTGLSKSKVIQLLCPLIVFTAGVRHGQAGRGGWK